MLELHVLHVEQDNTDISQYHDEVVLTGPEEIFVENFRDTDLLDVVEKQLHVEAELLVVHHVVGVGLVVLVDDCELQALGHHHWELSVCFASEDVFQE